jgi:hypothetical protein
MKRSRTSVRHREATRGPDNPALPIKTNRHSSLITPEWEKSTVCEATIGTQPEFRESLSGDQPHSIAVWAHINLGKIFDATNEREHAVFEYRQALYTKDNRRGALDEAEKHLEAPFGTHGELVPLFVGRY